MRTGVGKEEKKDLSRWKSSSLLHPAGPSNAPFSPPSETFLSSFFSLLRSFSIFSRCDSFMFARLSQLTRHLTRPSLAFTPAVTNPAPSLSPLHHRTPSTMTSSAVSNASKTIHTAACLIIGDEVLGGKVRAWTFAEWGLKCS